MNNNYLSIIKRISKVYQEKFGVFYNIKYDSRENIIQYASVKVGDNAGGFYDPTTKRIFIFSNIIDRIREKNYGNLWNSSTDNGLTYLIFACFHELEHRLQDEHPELLINQLPLSKTMYQFETAITACSASEKDSFYNLNHEMFFMEIDADIKGINNALAFSHFTPPIDNLNIDFYNLYMQYNNYRVFNYDIPTMINKFNDYAEKYNGIVVTNKYLKDKSLRKMYDSNGKVKRIDELMQLSHEGLINEEILPYIVCSEKCLKRNSETSFKLPIEQAIFLRKCIQIVMRNHRENVEKLDTEFKGISSTIDTLVNYTSVEGIPSRKKKQQMYSDKYYAYLSSVEASLNKALSTNKIGDRYDDK